MTPKIVIFDFDGTIVEQDLLHLASSINGKTPESQKLMDDFHNGNSKGVVGLIQRINLLKGVRIKQIEDFIKPKKFLERSTYKTFKYLNKHNIPTILVSGNIEPILEIFQRELKITYIIGNKPSIENGMITGITENELSDPKFKISRLKELLKAKFDITRGENILAIGDSMAEKDLFEFCEYSLAINPKGGIEKYADKVIQNLDEIIQIIER